jgi:superfamily I DNA/RNA helicase
MLTVSDQAYLIPAHIWTPWFSILGSKSGFDTINECFEDLSEHIFALETGLSSDPPMNWRISDLDRFTLVSNSDAHSPSKLGREANCFETQLSYPAIRAAIKSGDSRSFSGTIEFFPEEGKYHVDGHRKCGFRCLPEQTYSLQSKCPVCGRPLTLGVLNRVQELADRPSGCRPAGACGFEHVIPLDDILAEIFQVGSQSKKVKRARQQLLERFGSELDILRSVPVQDLAKSAIALFPEAIERMRAKNIHFEPGYDGEFGKVRIFRTHERQTLLGQRALFTPSGPAIPQSASFFPQQPVSVKNNAAQATNRADQPSVKETRTATVKGARQYMGLNSEQSTVVAHRGGPMMVVAGPGTGKTHTITCRMADLLLKEVTPADKMLAVTFTNKAAQEMKNRLFQILGATAQMPLITTFHGLCWKLLSETATGRKAAIIDEQVRRSILLDAMALLKTSGIAVTIGPDQLIDTIVKAKQALLEPDEDLQSLVPAAHLNQSVRVYLIYQQLMDVLGLFDFEDLIFKSVQLLESSRTAPSGGAIRFESIFVDEFQDINYAQYRLVRALAANHSDICVIGDPDQAIYGFRGSDARFFSRFSQDYTNVRCVHLTRNYRSTETILQSAFHVINKRTSDSDPTGPNLPDPDLMGSNRVYSGLYGLATVCVLQAPSARAEAVAIGKYIERLVGGTGFHSFDFGRLDGTGKHPEHSFSDIAVLFRTHEQGRLIAQVIENAGIPCQLADRDAWLQKEPVARLLGVMRLINGLSSYADLGFLSSLSKPSPGRHTIWLFKHWAYAQKLPLDKALRLAVRLPINGMSTARQNRLAAQIRLLESLRQQTGHLSVSSAVEALAARVAARSEDLKAQQRIRRLIEAAADFGNDQAAFLNTQALQKDTDLYRSGVEKVALMSMHAAKGLEFDVVFIAGCEQDLVPYRRPGTDRSSVDLDEERRLFYVAMTRARNQLYLCWALKRTLFGKSGDQRISPFVTDIEQRLRRAVDEGRRSVKQAQQQLALFQSEN